MKIKFLIVLNVIMLLLFSTNLQARKTISFEDEISLCSSPTTIMCSRTLHRTSLDDGSHFGGSLMVSFKTHTADEDSYSIDYKVIFDNQSKCDVTIGSTLLRHGSSINNLDWGNIEVDADETRTSQTHTFHFSQRDEHQYENLVFSYNGLANCPEED